MNRMIKELFDYRELLIAFTKRNIKMKYKQTMMGFLWAVFMPIVIVFSGIMVRKAMALFSGKPLAFSEVISVSVKALPWAFFVGALRFSSVSLSGNIALVTKIYFPRAIFPLSYVLGQLFDFAVACVAFAVLFCFAKIGLSIYLLWLPVLLFLLILLTAGLAMIFSCANIFFRDVRHIVDVVLTFGIFFTPVFFDASMFRQYRSILLLNPVGSILENINHVVVLHHPPEYAWLIYAAFWAILVFMGAWVIFQKAEPKFAEYI
jgi:ABC-type polysaccharide/polyol phosphate export permease